MKAAQIHQWGSLARIVDAPIPQPKPDQVMVKVHAAGINPIDYAVLGGYLRYFPLPFTFGFDAAGDVAAIGANVDHVHIGDAVYAELPPGGGFAEYVLIPADRVALKPQSLDFVHAGATPAAAQTAWQALFTVGGLEAGQKVLIHAAAGGVGHMAVQLAKWKGAYVIGTASAANETFVRDLGADEFIDYKTTRFEDVVRDADMVVVNVRNDTQQRSFSAVKPGGIVVSVVGEGGRRIDSRGVRSASVLVEYSKRDELEAITRLIDAGHVKPHVSARYPLSNFEEAVREVGKGHTRGKAVITIPR